MKLRPASLTSTLVFALLAAPLAGAQQPGKVWRIGFFSLGSRATDPVEGPLPAAFRQGLQQRGYVEGRNIAIEYRWDFEVHDRIPTSPTPPRRS